ncbi:MAG: hypothetical protein EXR71_05750 [Myxococcales bacterium]|nr:hypothetical protein [Myxococcales bacterium]
MSTLDAFSIDWTLDHERYHFCWLALDPLLTLPDGRELQLSLAHWWALREVLALLPHNPGRDGGSVRSAALAAPGHEESRHGKAWTAEEEDRVRSFWEAGGDPAEIGRALGRSRGAVSARLVRLGLLDEADANLRWPAGGRERVAEPKS